MESKILSHLHLNKSNFQISQSDWYCVGIAKFGSKYGHVFQSNIESLLNEAPSSSQRAHGNKRLIVISLCVCYEGVVRSIAPFLKQLHRVNFYLELGLNGISKEVEK